MTEASPAGVYGTGTRSTTRGRERMTLNKALDQLGQVERPLFHGKEHGNGNSTDRKFEQPWHAVAVSLRALGASVSSIARDLGMTEASVSSALQTPWIQAQVRAKLEEGERTIMDILKGETLKSVEVLVAIRDDEKVSANTRANVASGLLDRVLGKASQKVEVTATQGGDPVAEAQMLKEQIARDAGRLNLTTAHVVAGPYPAAREAAGSHPATNL